jgi:hypothetical protein
MGYDISVKFNSKQERDDMFYFLTQNEKLLIELQKTDLSVPPITFVIGEELGSYAPNEQRETLIGGHGSGIPQYAFVLCSWLACHSKYKNKDMPYIYYDTEIIKITYNVNGNNDEIKVDLDGIYIVRPKTRIKKLSEKFFGLHPEQMGKIMSELNSEYSKWLHLKNNKPALKLK